MDAVTELEQCLQFEQVAHSCTEWELTKAQELAEVQQLELCEKAFQLARADTDLLMACFDELQQRTRAAAGECRAAQLHAECEQLREQGSDRSQELSGEADHLRESLARLQRKFQDEKDQKRQLRAHCRELTADLEQAKKQAAEAATSTAGATAKRATSRLAKEKKAAAPKRLHSEEEQDEAPEAEEYAGLEEGEDETVLERPNAQQANSLNLNRVKSDAGNKAGVDPKSKRRKLFSNNTTASLFGNAGGKQGPAKSIFGGAMLSGLRSLKTGPLTLPKLKGPGGMAGSGGHR